MTLETAKNPFVGRGITLNALRDEQYSLNRQMLLAIQTCDQEAQEAIKARLAELQEEIERMTLRR